MFVALFFFPITGQRMISYRIAIFFSRFMVVFSGADAESEAVSVRFEGLVEAEIA